MKLKLTHLISLIVLGWTSITCAENRTWTDASRKHQMEGKFVALRNGKVTIRKTDGKTTTLPLEKLSPLDRHIAEQLADKGILPTGKVEASAKANLSQWYNQDNKPSRATLKVTVELKGEDARNAHAIYRSPHWEPATVEGKEVILDSDLGMYEVFRWIDRTEDEFFAKHPKDGVRIELDYGEVPANSSKVERLEGSVQVLVGGEEKTISLDHLATREAGPITKPIPLNHPSLKAAGLDLLIYREQVAGNFQIGIVAKAPAIGFVGIELIGSDGKPVPDSDGGSSMNSERVEERVLAKKEDLEGASLKIRFRQGSKKVLLPFSLTDIPIKK